MAPARARTAVAAIMLGAAVGAATLSTKALTAVAAVLMGAIVYRFLGTRRLIWVLVGSTFITLFRIKVMDVNLRLEHFVLLACLVALVLEGRTRALLDVAGDRTMLLFGAFVLWSASVSIFQSPLPADSLLIVAWLALDWLLLAVLVSSTDDARNLATVGATAAGVAGAVAVLAWLASRLVGTTFGVTAETDLVSGARLAFGLSFEPNLLGATMALWALVAFTGSTALPNWARRAVVAVATAGIVVSLTRAAGVGLLAGLAVWAAVGGSRALRKTAALAVSVMATMFLLATFAPKLAEPVALRASQAFDFDSGSGKLRLEYWQLALDDIRGYDLLFGLGNDTFGRRHLDPTDPSKPAYLGNLPLQVLYETGIVGVVLVTATVLSLFSRRRLKDGRALGLLTVYLICASATSPFWYGTTWVLVAIALIDRRETDRDTQVARRAAASRTSSVPVR